MAAGALPFLLLGGSAMMSLYGTSSAATAVEQAGEYNAQMIWLNTLHEIELAKEEIQATYGAQRAAFGASGLRVGTGSPLLVQAETLRRGARDVAHIHDVGKASAELARAEASAQAQALRIEGYTNVLSTTGTLLLI
jgi:hypothetical protein